MTYPGDTEEKMSANKIIMKIVSICFSILILILAAAGIYQGGKRVYNFGYRVFTEAPVDLPEESKDKVVQVTSGMGAKDLGNLLEKKGLIRDARLFVVQLRLSSYSGDIKPGTYTLSTSMTAQEMMQIMSAEDLENTETEE